MKKIVNLLGYGVFYTFAISIESFAPFILAPFLTRTISVYEYGLWAIFQAATAFLRPILGLTLDDFVRMRYHSYTRQQLTGYIVAIVTLSGLLALLLCTISMLFGSAISELLHFPKHWLWAIVICAWIYALFYMLLAFYQFEAQRKRYATIHLIQAAGTLLFTILLVLSGMSFKGAILGKIFGLIAGTGLAWWWVAKYFPESAFTYFRFSYLRELWQFGHRYLPTGMLIVVIIFSDRLMLAHMIDVEASSLFAVASLFPMVLLVVIQGYIYGWQPWCFKRLGRQRRDDAKELLIGAALFFIMLPIGGLILAWLAKWLGPYIIGENYESAFQYVPALTLAMVMQGYYFFSQTVLQFYQKLGTLSCIAVFTMLMNLLCNNILIAQLGTIGACYATAIAYAGGAILVIASAILQLRHYKPALGKE